MRYEVYRQKVKELKDQNIDLRGDMKIEEILQMCQRTE